MWSNSSLLIFSIFIFTTLLEPALQDQTVMEETEYFLSEEESSLFPSADRERLEELVILGEAVQFSLPPFPSVIKAEQGASVPIRRWPSNEAEVISSVGDQAGIEVVCQVRGDIAKGFFGTSEIWALVRFINWQGYVPNSFVQAPQQQFVVSNCLQGWNPMATTITVKPATSISFVYNDKGTGSYTDIAVYRADLSADPGFYSLGDVAMNTYSPGPATIYVISAAEDELQPPIDYVHVWNDGGSGGDMDGSFWQPIAPAGYVCLGHVAQNGYDKPSTDLIRCVRDSFVRTGSIQLVWQDKGSGAALDVGIWEIIPNSDDPQGAALNLFLSVNNYDQPWSTNYVLDREAVQSGPFAHHMINTNTVSYFAPKIILHPQEYYFPDFPSTFLENVHPENGFLVTNEPLGCDSCTDPAFLDGLAPDVNNIPVYAEIVKRTGTDEDIVDFIYWTFYPYNNGKRVCVGVYSDLGCIGGYSTFGNHVGDWEHTVVRLVDGYATKVYYSFHDSGLEFNWGDKRVGMAEGNHFIAFTALGSHGFYPEATRYTYQSIGNGDSLSDDTGYGIEWNSWKTLVPFYWQPQGTYSGSLEFLNIQERWGNPESNCYDLFGKHVCVLDQGPIPPMSKDIAKPQILSLS